MIPRFSLTRARQLDEAFEAFAGGAGDAAYIAGGTELLQVMKMGFAQFSSLIDLKPIAELHGISAPDGRLRIGAATSHRELERSAVVADRLPALVGLERRVANVRVRNQGTIGGNLAFAEPHSDPATLLLACDASLELAGPGGRRSLGVADFVLGPLSTARDPEEVLVAIDMPARGPGEGIAYDKIAFFERPAASVAVRLRVAGGRIDQATIAIGSIGEAPMVVPAASRALIGAGPADLAEATAQAREGLGDLDATPDLNGSADYKRYLAGVLLGRTVEAGYREATFGA